MCRAVSFYMPPADAAEYQIGSLVTGFIFDRQIVTYLLCIAAAIENNESIQSDGKKELE